MISMISMVFRQLFFQSFRFFLAFVVVSFCVCFKTTCVRFPSISAHLHEILGIAKSRGNRYAETQYQPDINFKIYSGVKDRGGGVCSPRMSVMTATQ